MVSGTRYISVNNATRHVVKGPIARHPRPVCGWKKPEANNPNSPVVRMTSGHRP
jgi:hypothetical protein